MLTGSTSARRTPRGRRVVSVAAVAALTIAGVGALGASAAQAATPRVSFASAVPTWATRAATVGAPNPNAIVEGEMFLPLQDQQGAEALATAVSDPASPQYRQYLTPQAWIATYAPTQADFDSAKSSLTGTPSNPTGLTITGTPASRQYIVYRGTVKAMDAHFGTSLATYSVQGHDVIAPSTTPSLPTAEAAHVAGLVLDQGRLLTRPDSISQAAAASTSSGPVAFSSLVAPKTVTAKTPCSVYSGQHSVTMPVAYSSRTFSTANCGYTYRQLRAMYGTTTASGSGQTVAVVGAYDSPTMLLDANTASRLQGDPQFAAGQYTDLSPSRSTFTDQSACGWASGWQGEQTLDVESLHAVAPGAKVVYSGATNCGAGTDIALSKVLDQGLATMVSNSYGGTGEPGSADADYVAGELNLQLQAAAEGIGLYFASGDNGDERSTLHYSSADFPASSPWVTAVGGTTVALTKTNTRAYTTGWGDSLDQVLIGPSRIAKYRSTLPGSFSGGAGGGVSRLFSAPSYQSSLVSRTLSRGARTVPDVAALASPYTGLAVRYHPITNNGTFSTGSWTGVVAGGTSLATPIYVGLMAAVQQSTGARVGFANPIIYSLAASSKSPFVDVQSRPAPYRYAAAYSTPSSTFLITFGADSTLATTKGYDLTTGVGELNVARAQGFATPPAAAN